jgi:hypothetical protein
VTFFEVADMKFGVVIGVWLLAVVPASGQVGSADAPLMAEDVFEDIEVLTGISVNEFMSTMGIFSASLGISCGDCHASTGRSWD